jgi:serine protease
MRYVKQTALVSALALGLGASVQAEPIALSQADASQPTANDPLVAEFGERYIIQYDNTAPGGPSSGIGMMRVGSGVSLQTEAAMIDLAGGHVALMLEDQNAIAAYLPASVVKQIANQGNVALVEVDAKRYQLDTTPYNVPQAQADQVSQASAGNRTVCVIDSGLDGNHRDFNFSNITGSNDPGGAGNWFTDGNGHGTHVAGTIAAVANGVDVVGMISNGAVNLHIVKVFDARGWAYSSTLSAAANDCAQNGADVINMSLGGGRPTTTERNTFASLQNQNVLSIAAAGNGGNSSLSYPASYDGVVSVAAIDSNFNRASFSQYNSQVELSAGGVQVLSTRSGGGTTRLSGTSMASPGVAGVAALVWSNYPSCTAAQIRSVLGASALDLGSAGRDNFYGFGLVQAKDAIDYLAANGCDGTGGGTNPDPDPDPEPPAGGALSNGDTVGNLSGAQGSELDFYIDVPDGATNLSISTSGGSGDVDLYVRRGAEPTTSTFDCRPYANGNSESCDTAAPQSGRHYIMLRGYRAFSGVTLSASFDEPAGGGGGSFFENTNNVNIPDSSSANGYINVTRTGASGTFTVDVDIKHTYRGDLEIRIFTPSGESATLKERSGSDSANNVIDSFTLNGGSIESQGQWRLFVRDHYNGDVGFIDSWSLTFD